MTGTVLVLFSILAPMLLHELDYCEPSMHTVKMGAADLN